MKEVLVIPTDEGQEEGLSLADLFLKASQSLAHSDARLYRSVDRHLSQTREILRQAEAATGGVPLENAVPTPGRIRSVPEGLDDPWCMLFCTTTPLLTPWYPFSKTHPPQRI